MLCNWVKNKSTYTVISVPSELHFAVVVPEVMVSTEYARSVLPNHVPFKEAAQNVSHAVSICYKPYYASIKQFICRIR